MRVYSAYGLTKVAKEMIKMTNIVLILAAGAFLLGTYPYEIGLLLPYVLLAGMAAVFVKFSKGGV